MRVALIHYWLTGMRGGERVLEAFARLFPEADIFTHVVDREKLSGTLLAHRIKTTSISRLPFARSQYQKYLGFMPRALEEIDLGAYDLVISSESGPAKGVIPRPDAYHLCYCHSPMRYIWDLYPEYIGEQSWLTRRIFSRVAHKMRLWDVTSAMRVDQFVANSTFVSQRIRKYYRREADIVFPPVDVSRFRPHGEVKGEGFYLAAGELVGYKRFDIAIDACERAGKRLVIVGDGTELPRLKARASGNVTFLNRVDFATLRKLFQTCEALIFPGIEDFGMIPVEVMASGRPVIAYNRGGALDTVVPGLSGLHVSEQSVEAFADAIASFDAAAFSPCAIVKEAQKFSVQEFNRRILEHVEKAGFNVRSLPVEPA